MGTWYIITVNKNYVNLSIAMFALNLFKTQQNKGAQKPQLKILAGFLRTW